MTIKEMMIEIEVVTQKLASGQLGLIEQVDYQVALCTLQKSLIKALLELNIRKVA